MFSWISSSKESFEKILFDLELKIKAQESKIHKLKHQELFYLNSLNSLYNLLLIYSLVIVLYSLFWKFSIGFVVLGILFVVVVEIFKKIVEWFYSARKKKLENSLERNKLFQLEKIEELKNKTAYYTTKGLIERYETPLKKVESDQDLTQNLETPKLIIEREEDLDIRKTISDHSSNDIPMSPSRSWVDRILDKIIGESGQFSKYALICQFCYCHNGLVMPENFAKQSFKCMACGKLNLSQDEKVKKFNHVTVNDSDVDISSPIRNNTNADKVLVLQKKSESPEKVNEVEKHSSLATVNGSELNSSPAKVNGVEPSAKANGVENHTSPTMTPTSSVENLKKKSSSKLKKRIKR